MAIHQHSWQYTSTQVVQQSRVWNIINAVIIILTIIYRIVWLWRKPTVRVFLLATLLMWSVIIDRHAVVLSLVRCLAGCSRVNYPTHT